MRSGLTAAQLLTPGSGYLQALAQLSVQNRLDLSAEAGWRIAQGQSLFARGWVAPSLGVAPFDAGVGVGYRWEW